MTDERLLKRIAVNPEIFGGKPIIRGMRISVELILSLLAQGETQEAILNDYPDLEPDDIRACIAYAHAVIAHDSLVKKTLPTATTSLHTRNLEMGLLVHGELALQITEFWEFLPRTGFFIEVQTAEKEHQS